MGLCIFEGKAGCRRSRHRQWRWRQRTRFPSLARSLFEDGVAISSSLSSSSSSFISTFLRLLGGAACAGDAGWLYLSYKQQNKYNRKYEIFGSLDEQGLETRQLIIFSAAAPCGGQTLRQEFRQLAGLRWWWDSSYLLWRTTRLFRRRNDHERAPISPRQVVKRRLSFSAPTQTYHKTVRYCICIVNK